MSAVPRLHALAVGLLLGVLAAAPAAAADDVLERVLGLAEAGAPRLALRIMDTGQPDSGADPEAWMRWERERIRIYQGAEDWAALSRRLEALPAGLPDDFRRWARSQQAAAYLALHRPAPARGVLTDLIWDPEATAAGVRDWRRMVIQSYLDEGRIDDAERAILRFQQDYGMSEAADLLLRARILLRAGRAAEAADLLADSAEEPEAGVLYLLAQLRSDARQPRRVLQAGLRQMRGEWVGPELKVRLWAVVAEAAAAAHDYPTWANALEHVVAEPAGSVLNDPLFGMAPGALWQAYLAYAAALGNEAQLLIGEDAPWLEAAEAASGRYPVKSRSFYALLAQRAHDPDVRERAMGALLQSLGGRRHGEVLLRRLFLEADRYAELERIPLAARHRLVDLALAESDIELASRLMATMSTPPEGSDRFLWQLRRARILVMGGQAEAGAEALGALIDEEAGLGREDMDRLLQVVFDLQTVGAHERALEVFGRALSRTAEAQLQREILYWMAESHAARGRHAAAARLYLQSALHQSDQGMDPWGQTARYQAAESLAAAGLTEDARRIYGQLLKVTDDPSRQAVLKRELQRLWLRQQAADPAEVAGAADAP